jgi:Ca-activated chloride channel family protein
MKLRNTIVMFALATGLAASLSNCAVSPATPTASDTPAATVAPTALPTALPGTSAPTSSGSATVLPSAAATSTPAIPTGSSNPVGATGAPTQPIAPTSPVVEEEKTKDNFFNNYGMNPFIQTEQDRLSTFAVDVDTAAYTWMRKSLFNNIMVNPSSVRTEEYINFFDYNYPKPDESKFTINTDLVNSPIEGQNTKLLRIGLQAKQISDENRKAAILTFVIDVSGSMDQENRLGLVKQSLNVLVGQLKASDKVAIVVFGSQARIVLEPTANKEDITDAINTLQTEGSTNTEAGLLKGYQLAEKNFTSGANNRIILCSDGVANVGVTGPDAMLAKIKQESESGISLSTVGFGMGNYNDVLMEQLADKGDGNYAYVDNLGEAQRIFAENLTGTLQVVAKDTKVQVNFNPEVVKEYRLLGYENRAVADNDFRNDQVDAGEVGSNHSVTALYELKLNDNVSGDVANVSIRYKDVDNLNSVFEISKSVSSDQLKDFDKASPSFKLAVAVAEYAEILRGSEWSKVVKLTDVLQLAKDINSDLQQPEKVNEFVSLVNKAISLQTLPQQ